jgi:very-short-patch-repair endonuclease
MRTASILRKNTTLPEKILWKRLRDRDCFSIKFRRQHPIYKFIVDFYCHELKLVIEVDGEIHNYAENIEYDLSRQAFLEEQGLRVLRFTNHQIIFELSEVLSQIKLTICGLTPLQGGRGVETAGRN